MMRSSRFQRLWPFLRREWRPRLLTALATVIVLASLSTLGVHALTRIDTPDAQRLRVDLGLEAPDAVCGGADQPACSYDDARQAQVDREFQRHRRMRAAILRELWKRVDRSAHAFEGIERDLRRATDLEAVSAAHHRSQSALADLRPLPITPREHRRVEFGSAADEVAQHRHADLALLVRRERRVLDDARSSLLSMAQREGVSLASPVASASAVAPVPEALRGWLGEDPIDADLARLLPHESESLATMLHHREDARWAQHFDAVEREQPLLPPSVRYRSPISNDLRWSLLGSVFLVFGTLLLLVAGPVATATQTAKEREAGTLPVLRMTGMSTSDLARAMIVGPNLFAGVAGGAFVLLALPCFLAGSGVSGWFLAVALLAVMSISVHTFAVGWGDALAPRVSPVVVGALAALVILVPGVVGTLMLVRDIAGTGLLLGPLPAVLAASLAPSGLAIRPDAMVGGTSSHGLLLLGSTLAVQLLVGWSLLHTWKHRVEQPGAPLFTPRMGLVLALASVSCSALSVLDLSERIQVQTYDHINLVTAVACAFLMPILGWLLASSLLRPARDGACITGREARRGFLRFQVFLLLTTAAMAVAYTLVLGRSGLAQDESAPMVATLSQCLLVGETLAATLLWAAQHEAASRMRILVAGCFVVLAQLGGAVLVYGYEVGHVMFGQGPTDPLRLALDASPYAFIFLMLLWAAGFGLILAALLRERDRSEAEIENGTESEDEEDNDETPPRWLH